MFSDLTISDFLDALASKEPVPGGGSSAALAGALGASLVSMVCNLTIGKKGYEAAKEEMQSILTQSEALRAELSRLLQADTEAYAQVMAAYRLPRSTEEEKATREAELQKHLKHAAEVPLQIAERCAQVVCLALPAARLGSKSAVSDAGVGGLLAEAAMRSALLNVDINLAGIHDQTYVQQMHERVAALVGSACKTQTQVMETVHKTISG